MDRPTRNIILIVCSLLVFVGCVSLLAGRWMVHRGSMMPTTGETPSAGKQAIPPGAQVIVLRDEETAKPLTTFEYATLVITGVGFAGGIATLVFLIMQTRAATESVRLTVREAMSARTQDIHRIFLDNPEIRPYFYEGRDCQPNDPDYARIQQMAELLCDFYDSLLMQYQLYPGAWDHSRWQRYIEDIISSSPVLREYLDRPSVRAWYRRGTPGHTMPDLITVLERVEARLPSTAKSTVGNTNVTDQGTASGRRPGNPNPQAGPGRRRSHD